MSERKVKTCSKCGGKLEYAALPKIVSVDKKSHDFAVFRVCTRCGRVVKSDADKASIPYLDELQKEKKE